MRLSRLLLGRELIILLILLMMLGLWLGLIKRGLVCILRMLWKILSRLLGMTKRGLICILRMLWRILRNWGLLRERRRSSALRSTSTESRMHRLGRSGVNVLKRRL